MTNSIVLFLKCHGGEKSNLCDYFQHTLSLFGKEVSKEAAVNIIKNDVKLTLSSARTVTSYNSMIVNVIGNIDQTRYNISLQDTKKISELLERYDPEFRLTNITLYNHYAEDESLIPAMSAEKISCFINLMIELQDKKGIATLQQLKRFIEETVPRSPPKIYIYLSSIFHDNDEKYDHLFFVNLTNVLLHFRKVFKSGNKIIHRDRRRPPINRLYNDSELAAINEMIHFYCIDNPSHKITDSMYFHCKRMIKHIFDESYKSWRKNMRDYDSGRVLMTKDEELFYDKNNEKIIDVAMDERSVDRHLSFTPNPGEPPVWRTYGIHIIKACHNGKTFCSAVNDVTQETPGNQEFLLVYENRFIKEIVDRLSLSEESMKAINDILTATKKRLSQIIAVCIILGFDKIYITDTSCRNDSYRATIAEEKKRGAWTEEQYKAEIDRLDNSARSFEQSDIDKSASLLIPIDEPDVGDLVEYSLPYKRGWSKHPGKIVTKEIINGDTIYSIDSSRYYEGVTEIALMGREITQEEKAELMRKWTKVQKKANIYDSVYFVYPGTNVWGEGKLEFIHEPNRHEGEEDYEYVIKEDESGEIIQGVTKIAHDEEDKEMIENLEEKTSPPFTGNIDEFVSFFIPGEDVWSDVPGKIVNRVPHTDPEGNLYYTYDIEFPGEIIDGVTRVQDYIKMHHWIGGKKGLQKRRSRKNKQRKGKKQTKKKGVMSSR